MGREKFRRYWIAGFVFSAVASVTAGLINFVSSWFSSLPLQTIYKSDGLFEVTIPQQLELMAIIILFAVCVVIIVPWLYGRLIEFLHNEFIIKKKT